MVGHRDADGANDTEWEAGVDLGVSVESVADD
jgi:hypothetical protein